MSPTLASSTVRHTLSNGMVALIYRNSSTATVSVQGEIRVGAVDEPASQAGLASFTASALVRGTSKRTFQQIAEETEARGCSVHSFGGLHRSGFSAKALPEDLPLVLEILADMLMTPTFPEREIEKLRGQFLTSLRERDQETSFQADRAMREMLYPEYHPYHRPSGGTIETIQHLSRDAIVAFHQRYHPAATTIAVVGNVAPEAVIDELERWFGPWNVPATYPPTILPPVPPLQTVLRRTIPMPGKVQSDIVWAVHGLARTDPDYYPAHLANVILGQFGMGGRLGDNVREHQGLAYHIASSLMAGLGAGPWLAEAGVNPQHVAQATQAILSEIEKFRNEGPTDEELADTRAYLTGTLVLKLETNAGIASTLLNIEAFNLGLDYIERYPQVINRVSRDEVIAVARKYLSTEHYVLAVAGPE